METKFLSRSYLETLSSADLISLADDYGIDIPDDLNRRFIIGELLEAAEEINQDCGHSENEMHAAGSAPVSESDTLPESYNETMICAILRNPVWAFVYWDFKESDVKRLRSQNSLTSLMLRVSFFDEEESQKPSEAFDVQVSLSDREQYVLLPAGKKFVRIDLVAEFRNQPVETFAASRMLELPHGCELLTKALPGRDIKIDPVLELSGMSELLRSHYTNHRQSFS
jgi:uncharacterized protein